MTTGSPHLNERAAAERSLHNEHMVHADFNLAPFTIAWEVTRACAYACVHCRADAQHQRDAGELSTAESKRLIEQMAAFGNSPILIFTGGDPMMRPDLFELIAYATQSFPAQRYANLSFQQMDAAQITFENQFDVVFSNATLHWIKDHRSVLNGVQKCLKPGGRILLQMGGRGNGNEIFATIDRLAARVPWQPYFHEFAFPYSFYGPDDYALWLEEAGLQQRRAELIHKDMKHQGPDGLAGWLRTILLPYIERVPPDLRERFIAEIVETYLQAHPLDEQGLTHVDMFRLEVEADKKVAIQPGPG